MRRGGLRTPLPGDRELLAFEELGRFLPKHSTAVSLLNRLLHHNDVVATDGESYAEGWSNQVRTTLHEALTHHARVGTFVGGHQRGHPLGN